MSVARTFTLSNGISMPSVGRMVRDQATLDACILEALRSGYRLIDTASVYKNEVAIGDSLKRILEQNLVPGLTRQDIFLTSKLAPKDQGYDACYQAVLESLQNLQVDYIDLYLIHWPGTAKLKLPDPQNAINRMESWHALEDLYHAKKLRAIGVSNYTLSHLTQLVERPRRLSHTRSPRSNSQIAGVNSQTAGTSVTGTEAQMPARTMVVPHVHQFELHPRLLQKDVIQFCQQHRIQVQAYSSLGEGRLISQTPPPPPPMDPYYNKAPIPGALDVMTDLIRKYFPGSFDKSDLRNRYDDVIERETEIGMNMDVDLKSMVTVENDVSKQKEYSKRAAQILLRWGLQHGAIVIPKSTSPERIRDNIDLFGFEIDTADMNVMDAYSVQGERTRYCWDPTDVC
ncbi:hypothetical protein BGX27_008279 [Mortierella sp. AM989]|nr:hypothetical protein BGX27_008279 [Mortierella sp. AM989]